MHGVVRPGGGYLDWHVVAQHLVGAEIGLIEGDAGGIRGRQQL